MKIKVVHAVAICLAGAYIVAHADTTTTGSAKRIGNTVDISCSDGVQSGSKLWVVGNPLADPSVPNSTPPSRIHTFTINAHAQNGWQANPKPTPVTMDLSGSSGLTNVTSVHFETLRKDKSGNPCFTETINVSVFVPGVRFNRIVRGVPNHPEPNLPESVGLKQTTALPVVYEPRLTDNPITYSVVAVGGDSQAGAASIRSDDPYAEPPTFLMSGDTATQEGHTGKLKVLAKVGANIIAVSDGFSVCAHPVGVEFSSANVLATNGGKIGAIYYGVLTSSSANINDLKVSFKEKVHVTGALGFDGPQRVQTDFYRSSHISDINGFDAYSGAGIRSAIDANNGTAYAYAAQHWLYACPICGMTADDSAPVIPHSGFVHGKFGTNRNGKYNLEITQSSAADDTTEGGTAYTPAQEIDVTGLQ